MAKYPLGLNNSITLPSGYFIIVYNHSLTENNLFIRKITSTELLMVNPFLLYGLIVIKHI